MLTECCIPTYVIFKTHLCQECDGAYGGSGHFGAECLQVLSLFFVLHFAFLQAPSFYSQDIPPNATFPGYRLKSRHVCQLPSPDQD